MNPKVKKSWVNSLRSEQYSQVKNALHTEEGFCCLGVLCDLYAKEHGKKWEEGRRAYTIDGQDGFLPKTVVKWSGLDSYNPTFFRDGCTISLSDLNDGGTNFSRIADHIEENF